MTQPAKVMHMIVSDAADSDRDYDEFIEDVKDALLNTAGCKNATVLLTKYHVDGEHISRHHYENNKE